MQKRLTGWVSSLFGNSTRERSFGGLPARITFFVFWATVITSLAVTAISIHSIQNFLSGNIDRKYPALLSTTADRLDFWYEQRSHEMGVFASSEILRDNVKRIGGKPRSADVKRARLEVSQYLSYLLESFPQYRELAVVDPKDRELIWSGDHLETPEGAAATVLDDSSLGIGPLHWVDGERLQVMSAPIGPHHGATPARLVAKLDLSIVDALLAGQDLSNGMRAVVVDQTGRAVASSAPLASLEDHRWLVAQPDAAVVVGNYAGPGGTDMVGARLLLERLGWTLVIEEPYDQAFAPVVSSISQILTIDLAIVLLFGLGAYRIAVSIVRPIEELSDAARRMADGEEHVVIPERGARDEMGLLIRTFNAMTMGLANKARELELSRIQVEDANRQLTARNDELQRVNEILEQLSITDGLTQLHNHRFFQDHLTRESRRVDRTGESLALVLADIDHFKAWNDRLGHAAGDRILRDVAVVMNELIRESDLLARYGGEEFALLAPGTDMEGAQQLAEKIRMAISEHPFFIAPPGEPEGITMSFGVSVYRGDRDRFFEDADRALYAAKAAGRDCVITADQAPA